MTADRLREAATRLRQLADATEPTRPSDEDLGEVLRYYARAPESDIAFIAAMSPAFARAVADLLDEAAVYEQVAASGRFGPIDRHALSVADVVLGKETP